MPSSDGMRDLALGTATSRRLAGQSCDMIVKIVKPLSFERSVNRSDQLKPFMSAYSLLVLDIAYSHLKIKTVINILPTLYSVG